MRVRLEGERCYISTKKKNNLEFERKFLVKPTEASSMFLPGYRKVAKMSQPG